MSYKEAKAIVNQHVVSMDAIEINENMQSTGNGYTNMRSIAIEWYSVLLPVAEYTVQDCFT